MGFNTSEPKTTPPCIKKYVEWKGNAKPSLNQDQRQQPN